MADDNSPIGSLKRHTIPPSTLTHFLTTAPWAHTLLTDPTFISLLAPVYAPPILTENTFLRDTLQNPNILAHHLILYRPPSPGTNFGEILTIFELGSGANGYPDTAHGGFLAVLFDELLGSCVAAEQEQSLFFTKSLKVEFVKMMQTPCVVLGRARMIKREGRKAWVNGEIVDGITGEVFAKGESFWLEPRGDSEPEWVAKL